MGFGTDQKCWDNYDTGDVGTDDYTDLDFVQRSAHIFDGLTDDPCGVSLPSRRVKLEYDISRRLQY